MILLGFDTETTGLNKQNDRIEEMGCVLYSTTLHRVLESAGYFSQTDGVLITPENTGLTGITQAAADRFGYEPGDALDTFISFATEADAIIGHNSNRFDLAVLQNAAKRLGRVLPEKLSIDTMTDIPGVKGEQLITMCAKAGFTYKAHGALADANAVIDLAEYHAAHFPERSFEKIAERAQSPLVLLQSLQDRKNNDAAKKLQFRWNPDKKIWWKAAKEMDVQALAEAASFKIVYIDKSITYEELDS